MEKINDPLIVFLVYILGMGVSRIRKIFGLTALLFAGSVFLVGCSEKSSSPKGDPGETPAEEPKLPFVGGPVIFTEVDPINTVYEDHEGGDAGWVEIFNTSAEPVNLNGVSLTNSLDEPAKWTFGNVVMAPGSHMVVFLSGKDLPDYVAPHDSMDMVGYGCWSWDDSMNEDVAGESVVKWLPGQSKLCFKEEGATRFGASMKLGENAALGWASISAFVGTDGGSERYPADISAANELLLNACITKGTKLSMRLAQVGIDDWKGYEIVLEGTGDSSTVYRIALPSGTTFPDLENIYGTRFSPESGERGEVTLKGFSYIARNRGHEPHAGFKIKNGSGSLYLVSAQNEILDSVAYKQVPVGKTWSFGFLDSLTGVVGWGFAAPSPYGLTAGSVVQSQSPGIDTLYEIPASGFCDKPFVLSFAEEEQVHCGLGGLLPTENSPQVTTVTVESTTVLRCASFMPGALPGNVVSRTYVFEKRPQIPVVFVAADPNSLFSPDSGIYMEGPNAEFKEPHYGANYWQDKEIPVFVELLEKEGVVPAFAKDAGLKIFGNYSRANSKKSVAITFREKYGDKRLKYPLFPEFPELNSFKGFILRNNGSNAGNDYIRDMLATSISEGLGVDYQRGRASVVYYNGEYFGIHNIRERSTEYYFETHYGMDPKSIDLLKADNSSSAGSGVDYVALMDWLEENHLDDEDNFAKVAAEIDVDNFMNYVHLETFVDNRDWPGNNLKKWRSRNPNTLWKWFIYDTDFGFGTGMSEFSNNVFEFAAAEDGDTWPNGPEYTLLLRRLLENEGFRQAFVNRMAVLLKTNFSSDRILSRISTLMSAIEPEIERDQERWDRSASYMDQQLEIIKNFAVERQGVIQDEIQEYFGLGAVAPMTLSVEGLGNIYVHGLRATSGSLTVDFFAGLPVVVTAEAAPGGVWAGWSDGVMDAIRVVNPGEELSLTALFK